MNLSKLQHNTSYSMLALHHNRAACLLVTKVPSEFGHRLEHPCEQNNARQKRGGLPTLAQFLVVRVVAFWGEPLVPARRLKVRRRS